MSTIKKTKGFTLLEVVISISISMILLLSIVKINIELVGNYIKISEESIVENSFDNALLNLDNIINGYLVSNINTEDNKIIIKYDIDIEENFYKIKKIYLNNKKLMVETNNYDSDGFSKGNNVILNNVREFNVYVKDNLIYYKITLCSGESRIKCI